jgi:nucleoside-diphosphate-sugar epimerase
MENVLIVGANSFLAQAICNKLKGQARITGVYHKNRNNLDPEVLNIPVTQLGELKDEYEKVFFISAYIPRNDDKSHLQQLKEINEILLERVCHQFKRARIIYASTVSVYGLAAGLLNEKSAGEQLSAYGASKLQGERIVKQHESYSIIRISSMYGVGMAVTTFLPLIILSALSTGNIKLFGKGERKQNYIHVSDVAEFFVRASQQNQNNTYLAVGLNSCSNYELAQHIQSIIKGTTIAFSGVDQSKSFEYDATESYSYLNYKPQKDIRTGIDELIQWKRKMY